MQGLTTPPSILADVSRGSKAPDLLALRLDLLFAQAPAAVGAAVVLGLLTVALLWPVADGALLLGWLSAVVGVNSARLAIARAYRVRPRPQTRVWFAGYLLGTLLSGCVWGLIGLVVDFSWPAVHQVGAFAVLAGVCAGALSNNGSHLTAYLAFLLPCLGLLVVRLFWSGDSSLMLLGGTAVLYGAGLLSIALPYGRNLDRAQRLALDKQTLLDRTSAFNAELHAEVMQRREAEAELERERRLFLAGPVTVFRWANDDAWTICAVSPNVSNLGFDAATLVHDRMSYKAIIHPEDRDRVAASEFQDALAGTLAYVDQDYRILLPDGDIRWVYDYTVPVLDAAGEVTHLDGYILDITDRKRAEAELLREKERAQVTLHSIGDGIVRTDAAGRVEYLNPVAERLTGWSTREARGHRLNAVCKIMTDTDASPADLLSQSTEQAARDIHYVLRHRDGMECSVTCTAAPLSAGTSAPGGTVLVIHDVSEARSLAQRLDHQANHDPLTGLVNRPGFEHRLTAALDTAGRSASGHVCLYMDLDQFKVVNDTCGHAAGDELLRQVAAVLASRLRATDVLARLGGDEFGVLLYHCPPERGRRIAESLLEAIRALRYSWAEKTFSVAASIGVVPVAGRGEGVAAVLSAADVACYAAKDLGRNRVHLYEESDLELARRHGEMQYVSRITKALAEDRLVLYGQDIAPIGHAPERLRIMEILVRMQDEDGSLVPPGTFLPAAERYNLMPVIDRWVVRHSFAWLAQRLEPQVYRLTINLSGTTLSDDQFLDDVTAIFREYAVPPGSICFEITETAAIASLATASRFIREFRSFGCRFALDDFGTGLSSFSYLKNLPVDFLKIDGAFVRNLLNDPLDRAMVQAINDVGHAMGIQTIAEFVEHPDTLQLLEAIGVDYAQGWAIGPPRPLADIGEVGATTLAAG